MNTQSNTKAGLIRLPSSVDLSGKEGYLAKIVTVGGVAKAALATAVTDYAIYVIEDGGDASGDNVDLRPLEPGRNVRIKVAAAGAGGDAGALVTLQADGTIDLDGGAGARTIIGVAEEVFTKDQTALVRPMVLKLFA